MRSLAFAFVLLVAPSFAVPAGAHEYWLAPSRYRAAAGDPIALGAFVGTGFRGEARPFATARAVRFLARGPAVVDLARGASNGALAWGRPAAGDDAGTLVAYVSNFATIELPAGEFEEYLALEGLESVIRARQAAGAEGRPGRERYRRACKAWIAGRDDAKEAARRATTGLGLPLEIVPQVVPGSRDHLPLEVRFDGKPLAGALVRAWRQPLARGASLAPMPAAARDSVGPAVETRTDAQGRVTLELAGPGEWLVSTVHMVRSQDEDAADWESTWSSLTFAVPPR